MPNFNSLKTLFVLVMVIVVGVPTYGRIHDDFGLPELRDLPGWLSDQADQAGAAGSATVDTAAAKVKLAKLQVRPAGSMTGYSRDAFRHWSDPDGNGCDAREDTLRRDGQQLKPTRGCKLTTGVWKDPYGGETFRVPGNLDIDHVVPLANAWRSGAAGWSAARREKLANDPRNLLAVSASLNRQKGDKGPEAWKPPRAGYRAAYAARWIRVKSDYGLSVTPAEKSALQKMLG